MQQRNNTLRIKKTTFNKMVWKRNGLFHSEGLGVDDLAALEERRPGAAFVIACVFLIEEMAAGTPLSTCTSSTVRAGSPPLGGTSTTTPRRSSRRSTSTAPSHASAQWATPP